MTDNEEPKLDPEFADDSINELLAIQKIKDEIRAQKESAIKIFKYLHEQQLVDSTTILEDLPAIINGHEIRVSVWANSEKNQAKKKEYYNLLDELRRARGAVVTLRNGGLDVKSGLSRVENIFKEELKKAEDVVHEDEITKCEENRKSQQRRTE